MYQKVKVAFSNNLRKIYHLSLCSSTKINSVFKIHRCLTQINSSFYDGARYTPIIIQGREKRQDRNQNKKTRFHGQRDEGEKASRRRWHLN